MHLKGKVLLGLVPVVVISLLSLGYIAYTKLAKQKEHDIIRQVELVSEHISIQTQAFIDSATTNTKLLATSEPIRQYLDRKIENSAGVKWDLAVRGLISRLQSQFPEFTEINLYKPDNNSRCVMPSVSSSVNASGKSAQFCEHMFNSALVEYSEFQFDDENENSILLFGHKIAFLDDSTNNSDKSNAEKVAVIVFEINAHVLRDAFLQHKQSNASTLLLFDKQGRHTFNTDTNQIGTLVSSATELLNNSITEFKHDMHDKHHGLVMLPDYEGSMALATQLKLHNNLYYAGIVPHSLLRVAHNEVIPSVLLITVFAILLTTATLWKLLDVMILLPIRELQSAATLLGNGQAIPKQKQARSDEIGQLQNTFYEMSGKLEDSITELRQSHERIEQLAYIDSLTGLPNRRKFLDLFSTAIEEQKNSDGKKKIGAFFIDVDDFKRINDLLGHEAGDMMLQVVGQRLTDSLKNYAASKDESITTVVGRLGGDEFVVSVSAINDHNDISSIAKTMQDSLTDPICVNNQRFQVSISFGMAMYPDHGMTADEVLKSADIAMYDIKSSSKNGYTLFCNEMADKVTEKAELEYALRGAIARKELHLAYQPQVCAITNKTLGMEALLRWDHPEKGNIPPDVFIPIAEQFGSICSIGYWVLNEACEQWKAWSDAGIAPARVAVNVSQRQLSQIDLKSQVLTTLNKHQMPATALEIELTESCIMEAPLQVVETIQEIRDMGVRIALDDFGTGYSSLASLASLPIDTIKLDRSFVTNVNLLSGNSSIVSAVLSLAQDLNLETVAEGVETEPEKLYLQERHCDILQGYLLSRPMDKLTANEWLSASFGSKPENKVA